MTDQTVEQFAAEHLASNVTAIATHLRYLADMVERIAKDTDRVGSPGIATYAGISSRVQHDVLWGVANLALDQLTNAAVTADQARARRLAGEAIAAAIEAKATEVHEGASSETTGFALAEVVAEGARIAREYAVKEG